MQDLYSMLRQLTIPDKRIFAEAFGPAKLIRDSNTIKMNELRPAQEALVKFSDSQFEHVWSTNEGSLLEFAETHGLTPKYGCRNGQCGSCKVKLLSGKVTYEQAIEHELDEGELLLCCAVPAENGNAPVIVKI